MISVIIPLYNKELSIGRTIESVLKQTYVNFELIVVDDGSTDRSAEVVESIPDKRIRLIKKVNGGVSSARNRGVEEAMYDWIAFLDGDDLWHEDYLLEVIKIISCPENVDVITTDFAMIKKDKSLVREYIAGVNEVVDYFKTSNELGWGIINMSTFCASKRALISAGLFREDMTHGEDMYLFENLARNGKIWLIGKILSYYIQDAENRAMNKLPDVLKTRVYHAPTNNLVNVEEIKYYKTAILKSINTYLFKLKFGSVLNIYKKHYKFIGIGEISTAVMQVVFSRIAKRK